MNQEVVVDESKPSPDGPYVDEHDEIIPGGVYHLQRPGGRFITVNARGKRVNPDGSPYDPNVMDDGESDEETQLGGTVSLT